MLLSVGLVSCIVVMSVRGLSRRVRNTMKIILAMLDLIRGKGLGLFGGIGMWFVKGVGEASV